MMGPEVVWITDSPLEFNREELLVGCGVTIFAPSARAAIDLFG